MCGRYVVHTPPQQLALDFDAALRIQEYPPDYNVAPTKPVPAVLERDGERMLSTLRWGLVPFWAKDPSVGAKMINARIESAAEKPAFRRSFAARRCLLPADGYYEWLALAPAADTSGRDPSARGRAAKPRKQPYFVRPAGNGPVAFAGLYERWRDAEGNELWSASILTAPAVTEMAWLHDRMPLTVPPASWSAWLDPRLDEPAQVRELLDFRPEWVTVAVTDRVNAVRENDARLIEPLPDDPRTAEPPAPDPDTPRAAHAGMGEVSSLF
jgi:putative SOS response-associated peptidase YedK